MEGTGRRRLYLMRHGHVDYFDPALKDPRMAQLTAEGQKQATAASEALRRIPFDIAFFSGLDRTRQTAEIVLDAHENAPELQQDFGFEEIKAGFLQGVSREEAAARIAFGFDNAHTPGARFLETGESFMEAQQRVAMAMENLIFQYRWKNGLLVAHEGINRIILSWLCGGGLATLKSFEQDLACVNVIDLRITPNQHNDGLQIERAILKAVNITPYDYLKHGLERTSLEHLFEIDFDA